MKALCLSKNGWQILLAKKIMSQCVFLSKEGKGFFENFLNFAVFNVFPLRVHKIVNQMGIFTIKVPLFGHKTWVLSFCYLLNIKSKWNKFKWRILDNSNYDHFHGGGDFSHVYVIMHKYLVKNQKCKKWVHKLLYIT
jgi:hypothetical protein